ncbi:MAG: CaiB/BaiF CoA transferase family protein [Acidimicrobiales bacterium]
MASSSPPLHGVRVLSLGAVVAGNITPLLLAELGADVVKVESRDHPEALRAYDSPDQAELFEPSGVRTTALFAGLTRRMRSVCVDMGGRAGRDTFRSLASRAHVVIENLAPGTVEEWGCSFVELHAHNPRLVMLSMSGYGRSGPLAGFRAYASSIGNHIGLTAAWAPDGTHFDFVAGLHGASAVVAALAAVDNGAPGVSIDLAQTESGAAIMAPLYLDFLANGNEGGPGPNEVPGSLLSAVFPCSGADAWVAIDIEDARDWEDVCTCLDRRELSDPDSLRDALAAWARGLTPLQAAGMLQRLGVAAAPVQNGEDLWRDPQLRSRGAFVEISHPDVGVLEYPDTPCRVDRDAGRALSRGPRLGEHTAAVLAEWLELGEPTINDLARTGAIWQPDA